MTHGLPQCVLVCVLAASAAAAQASPAGTQPAEGWESGMERYAAWLRVCLTAVRQDLRRIAAQAAEAARFYVQDGCEIAAYGDMGFAKELNNRAGGLMRMQYAAQAGPEFRGIVLAALRDDHLDEDLRELGKLQGQGCKVVAIARASLLREARKKGAAFEWELDNRAARHGGLFPAGDGRRVVATEPTANVIAAWTWTAEFVAACTRLGKMPTMFQSYAVPGAKARAEKLWPGMKKRKDRPLPLKFHEEAPPRVRVRVLGLQYLDALEGQVAALCREEAADIAAAAELAVRKRKAGHGVYLYAQNHAQLSRLPCAHDGGYFVQINRGWVGLKPGVRLTPNDLVLCIGYDNPFTTEDWRKFDTLVRSSGATLAWAIATYNADEVAKIPAGQILIDQKWSFGDAVVTVPGYDIKILPTSGAMAEATLWIITAGMRGLEASTRPAR